MDELLVKIEKEFVNNHLNPLKNSLTRISEAPYVKSVHIYCYLKEDLSDISFASLPSNTDPPLKLNRLSSKSKTI